MPVEAEAALPKSTVSGKKAQADGKPASQVALR